MQKIVYRALEFLALHREEFTLPEVADHCERSLRTLHHYLPEIKAILANLDIELVLVQGHQSFLRATPIQVQALFDFLAKEKRASKGTSLFAQRQVRLCYILHRLLVLNQPITSKALSQTLLISNSQLQQDLKVLERQLITYDIQLLRDKWHRLRLETGEKRTRVAILDLLLPWANEHYFGDYLLLQWQSDVHLQYLVEQFLHKSLLSCGLAAPLKQQRIVDLILISLYRLKQGKMVKLAPRTQHLLDDDLLKALKQSSSTLEHELKLYIPKQELIYWSAFIKGHNFYHSTPDTYSSVQLNCFNHIYNLLAEIKPELLPRLSTGLLPFLAEISHRHNFDQVYHFDSNSNSRLLLQENEIIIQKLNDQIKQDLAISLPTSYQEKLAVIIATLALPNKNKLKLKIYRQLETVICDYNLALISQLYADWQEVKTEDQADAVICFGNQQTNVENKPCFVINSVLSHKQAKQLALKLLDLL